MPDSDVSLVDLRREFAALLDRLEGVPAQRRSELFSDGQLDRLFRLLAPPFQSPGGNPYDYFLEHKAGLTTIARLRQALSMNYSVRGRLDGQTVFLSPDVRQWFEERVMFLHGDAPFVGLLGRYWGGQIYFAVSARDAKSGESLGPNDFHFVEVATARKQLAALRSQSERDAALPELQKLLGDCENHESEFQKYFTKFPWVLGALHSGVHSHVALDDKNIPDFSAVRARDGARDILEIKPPFLPLFRGDGEFSGEFNSAWNQAERYLDFTRREADYLWRQKGLRFETPHCYLIAGYSLSDQQRDRIQSKERLNPAVTFLTYDEVVTLLKNTLGLVNRLSSGERGST